MKVKREGKPTGYGVCIRMHTTHITVLAPFQVLGTHIRVLAIHISMIAPFSYVACVTFSAWSN